MNIDHLNFVVEARYYGYWIALVFAIICLLMFVYIKILDAKKQKKLISYKRNVTSELSKELVRKISGFFFNEKNCRGYDPNTPIGEIAKHAFLHWRQQEQQVENLKRIIRKNADLLELEKEKLADARKIACDYQDVIHYVEEKERYQKYKRCLAMAKWCESWIRLDVSPRHTIRFIRWWKKWTKLAEYYKE